MFWSTSSLAAAALAFAQTALAAPAADIAVRNDPHKLDFRTFGTGGCFAENQGVYTLVLSQAGVCHQFVEPIGSLLVADNLCTLTVYSDDGCTEAPAVIPTAACQNGTWQSYEMTC